MVTSSAGDFFATVDRPVICLLMSSVVKVHLLAVLMDGAGESSRSCLWAWFGGFAETDGDATPLGSGS